MPKYNLSDHPLVVFFGIVVGIAALCTACISLYTFLTGRSSILPLPRSTQTFDAPTNTPLTSISTQTNLLQPTYTPPPMYTQFPTNLPTATSISFSSTPAIMMSLPFEDSFELRPRSEWETIIGTWRVVDGHFTAEKEGAGRQMILVGDKNWQNYTITVTIFDDHCGGAGMIARATDDGYMEFHYDGNSFQWKLVRGGNEETIADVSRNCYEYQLNGAHTYKVSVNGDIFTGYVDGQQLLQTQDSTYSHGRVGLAYISYYLIWFDNFKITSP